MSTSSGVSNRVRALQGDAPPHQLRVYENVVSLLFACPACPAILEMQAKYIHGAGGNTASWEKYVHPRILQVNRLRPLAHELLWPLFVNIVVNQRYSVCHKSRSRYSIDAIMYREASYLFYTLFEGLRINEVFLCEHDLFLDHAPKLSDLEAEGSISDIVAFSRDYRLSTILGSEVTRPAAEVALVKQVTEQYGRVGFHNKSTCPSHNVTGSAYSSFARSNYVRYPPGVDTPSRFVGYYIPSPKTQEFTALFTAIEAVRAYALSTTTVCSSSQAVPCPVFQSALSYLRALNASQSLELWIEAITALGQRSALPSDGRIGLFDALARNFELGRAALASRNHSWICYTGVIGLSHHVTDDGSVPSQFAVAHPMPADAIVQEYDSCSSDTRRHSFPVARYPIARVVEY